MNQADDLCVGNEVDIYLCPGTTICTSSYYNCDRIDDVLCPASGQEKAYFTCDDTSTTCVENVMTDCCGTDSEGN